MSFTVHPTAIIDDGAEIGEDSRIWHFVHVCGGAKVGKGVSLGQNVFVGSRVVIGDFCKIQNKLFHNILLNSVHNSQLIPSNVIIFLISFRFDCRLIGG